MAGGKAEAAHPVLVACPGPVAQRRWTVLVRLVLAVPHLVVLYVLELVLGVVVVIGWFGALLTGRLPLFAGEFASGFLRWQTRVVAYTVLLTDAYPPFTLGDADYPVRVAIPLPDRLNRWAVLFRAVLGLPAAVLASMASGGAGVLMVVFWVICLVTGRLPRPVHGAVAAVVRYAARVGAYAWMLTPVYPAALFGDPEGAPTAGPGETPAQGPSWHGGAGTSGRAWPGPAPVAPDLFTFGGPTFAWGYSADRRFCGVWVRHQPALGWVWPIERQDDAWRELWRLEPAAVELGAERPAPPPAAPAPRPLGLAPGSQGWPGAPGSQGWPGAPGGAGHSGRGAAGDQPAWQLVLSRGAKLLMVVFIVVGAGYAVADVVGVPLGVNGSGGLRQSLARTQVESAYQTLSSRLASDEQRTCSTLACAETSDRMAASAFGTFLGSIRSISMPPDALGTAGSLIKEVDGARRSLATLASSTSVSEYEARLKSADLAARLQGVDRAFADLDARLGGATS